MLESFGSVFFVTLELGRACEFRVRRTVTVDIEIEPIIIVLTFQYCVTSITDITY
jgi:hypothetical protein